MYSYNFSLATQTIEIQTFQKESSNTKHTKSHLALFKRVRFD